MEVNSVLQLLQLRLTFLAPKKAQNPAFLQMKFRRDKKTSLMGKKKENLKKARITIQRMKAKVNSTNMDMKIPLYSRIVRPNNTMKTWQI